MVKFFYRSLGFSLIELMIVVVIIGVLASVAIPSYQAYVLNSKIAEAYVGLDKLNKNQVTFFHNNDEFFSASNNPIYVGSTTIVNHASWNQFGYVYPVGSNVHFSYSSIAGKIDSSGTEAPTSSISGNNFRSTTLEAVLGASALVDLLACSRDGAVTPQSIGVTPSNGLDWVVLRAHADLDRDNADGLCTVLFRVTQSNSEGIISSAVVTLYKGH